MKDTPIEVVIVLVAEYGASLLADPDRLGQLLEKRCSQCANENFFLMRALSEAIEGGWSAASPQGDMNPLSDVERAVLERNCMQNLGFSREEAAWASHALARILSGEGLATAKGDHVPRRLEARKGNLPVVGGLASRPRMAAQRRKAVGNSLIILAIFCSLLLLMFRGHTPTRPPQEQYPIALVISLTGQRSALGRIQLKAAQLACEEINARGGVKGNELRAQVLDLPGDAREIGSNVRGVFEQAVPPLALVAACGDEAAVELAGLAETYKTPLVAVSATRADVTTVGTRTRAYAFRLVSDNAYRAKRAAYFLVQGLSRKTCGLLYDGGDVDAEETVRALQRWLELFGVTVTAVEPYSQAANALRGAPEALLFTGGEKALGEAIRTVRESGYRGAILGIGGYRDALWKEIGEPLAGSWWVVEAAPGDPALQPFLKAYRSRYNEDCPREFVAGAVFAYDAVRWIADAFSRVSSPRPELVRHALLSTKNLPLAHATLTIDPRTHGPWNKAGALIYCTEGKGRFQKRFWPK